MDLVVKHTSKVQLLVATMFYFSLSISQNTHLYMNIC